MLYLYANARLPFNDAEAGTVTTLRKTDEGRYEPIQFTICGSSTNALSATNSVFSRLDMTAWDFYERRLTPNQVHMACLAPGGASEDGATTNTCAYAIGVFGSGKEGELPLGTGYAVLEAFSRMSIGRKNPARSIAVTGSSQNGRTTLEAAPIPSASALTRNLACAHSSRRRPSRPAR